MTRLNKIIKEVLSTKKKKDCNCGCGGCAKKSPTLTENKVKEFITEGLQYHIANNISLFESVYRIGSEKHLDLINEARALWVRGLMDVSEDDQALLETHLGHFGLYEGVEVPLDLPMLSEQMDLEDELANEEFGMDYNQLGSGEKEWVRDEMDNMSMNEKEGVPHYTKDGKEWKGKVHKMPNGKLMTQNPHNEDSEELFHKEELNEDQDKWVVYDTKTKKRLPNAGKIYKDKKAAQAFADKQENAKVASDTFYFDKIQEESLNEEMGEWPKKLTSRYSGEYRFEFDPTYEDKLGRAKYRVIDIESGELKGTPVFGSISSLKSFADDLIKPQGGTQSTNLGESLNEVEIGDTVKIDKNYGGGKGVVDDKIGSYVIINGESYHESDVKVTKSSLDERINTILEAKKKKKKEKKDPPLNKPERGGSKAYFVYVRDPKTKKIKKVSFGSGGLRAKINNKQARNAFAARHKCSTKKDRTTAGYWSCNLPKYADQLGLGSKMNTFW